MNPFKFLHENDDCSVRCCILFTVIIVPVEWIVKQPLECFPRKKLLKNLEKRKKEESNKFIKE